MFGKNLKEIQDNKTLENIMMEMLYIYIEEGGDYLRFHQDARDFASLFAKNIKFFTKNEQIIFMAKKLYNALKN